MLRLHGRCEILFVVPTHRGLLDRSHCQGRTGQDIARPSLDQRVKSALLCHLCYEAHSKAVSGADLMGTQQQAHGLLQSDLTSQTMYASSQRDGPDSWFGESEFRIRVGKNDIAGQGNLEAAAKGQSINRCDNRLVEVISFDEARIAMERIGGFGHVRVESVAKIRPCAKSAIACPRDDADPLMVIKGEGVERSFKRHMHVGIDRVQHMRAIEYDGGDAAVDANVYRIGHGIMPGISARAALQQICTPERVSNFIFLPIPSIDANVI